MQLAITGNPVQHSLSPMLFGAAYSRWLDYGLLPAQSAEETVQLFKSNGLRGMNVTSPFKQDILLFVDEMSEEVKAIGAANAVVALANGRLRAYNTDYVGVVESLREFGINLKGKQCLVIGAGGAGLAAAYGLKEQGADVVLVNRSLEKARQLAKGLKVDVRSLSELAQLLPSADVIVNTLSPSVLIKESYLLRKEQVVFDASYTGSPFLDAAKQKGCLCIDGRYWLFHQAIPAYWLFTSVEPNESAMRQLLKIEK